MKAPVAAPVKGGDACAVNGTGLPSVEGDPSARMRWSAFVSFERLEARCHRQLPVPRIQ